jgi:hypothetical protein
MRARCGRALGAGQVSAPLEDALLKVGELAAEHGVELLGKWLAGNVPEDEALEMLDAQYAAARAASDAEAKAILDAEGIT